MKKNKRKNIKVRIGTAVISLVVLSSLVILVNTDVKLQRNDTERSFFSVSYDYANKKYVNYDKIDALCLPGYNNFIATMKELFPNYLVAQPLDKPLVIQVLEYNENIPDNAIAVMGKNNILINGNQNAILGGILEHELFHIYSANFADPNGLGHYFQEGITDFLTEEIFDGKTATAYTDERAVVRMLSLLIGVDNVIEPYLNGGSIHDIIATLDEKYGGSNTELIQNMDSLFELSNIIDSYGFTANKISQEVIARAVTPLIDYLFIYLEASINSGNLDNVKKTLGCFERQIYIFCDYFGATKEEDVVRNYFYTKKDMFLRTHKFDLPNVESWVLNPPKNNLEWSERKYLDIEPTYGFFKAQDSDGYAEHAVFLTSKYKFIDSKNTTVISVKANGQYDIATFLLEEMQIEDIAIFNKLLETNQIIYEFPLNQANNRENSNAAIQKTR